MAVSGKFDQTSIIIQEDLSGKGAQNKAVSFSDGKLAATGVEANGILQNMPSSLQHAAIGLSGEMKYVAGGAIAAGGKITVSGSGFFTACASGDWLVGANGVNAVTSGSVGRGVFNFDGGYQVSSL